MGSQPFGQHYLLLIAAAQVTGHIIFRMGFNAQIR